MKTLLLSVICAMSGDQPAAWPGFLGAGATEVSADSLPLSWTHDSGVAWKCDLPGQGQSSPVIWGDKVYVTSIEGSMKDTCHVTAVGLADGAVLWKWSTPSSQPVRSNYFQSRSAPTPVADAQGVYAFFETGDVVAIDHDGTELWRRSLTEDYGDFESTIGLASSPMLVGEQLVLLIDHEGPSYLLALDRTTGETSWQSERDSRKSYSSPMAMTIAGKTQIVVSSDGSVDGYDPASGEKLWSYDQVGGNTSCSPIAFGEGRMLIGASAGMHGEREADARKSNLALSIEATENGYEPKVMWLADKAMPTFASPMVHQGLAYWVNRVGVVFCFDADSGELQYSERVAQTCWATPIGVEDRIYLFGKDGVTTVIAAGREFKVLAENTLWDPTLVAPEPLARRRAAGTGAETHQAGEKPEGEHSAGEQSERPAASQAQGETQGGPQPGPPAAAGGRPAPGSAEEAALRDAMAGVFADPVQYGVAMVPGSIVIRTGTQLHCVRQADSE